MKKITKSPKSSFQKYIKFPVVKYSRLYNLIDNNRAFLVLFDNAIPAKTRFMVKQLTFNLLVADNCKGRLA